MKHTKTSIFLAIISMMALHMYKMWHLAWMTMPEFHTTRQLVHSRCLHKQEITKEHPWCKENPELTLHHWYDYCRQDLRPRQIQNGLVLWRWYFQHTISEHSQEKVWCDLWWLFWSAQVHKENWSKQVSMPSKKGLFYSNVNNDVTLITTIEDYINEYKVI